MTGGPHARVSVVVPTRNRHQLLEQCLRGVADSAAGHDAEIIVVDDGSSPAIAAGPLPGDLTPVVVRLEGAGPAAARNAGVRAAKGDIVLFIDDDAVPSPAWVAAALGFLDRHPTAVGVGGPIRSIPWDPLYEQSIETDTPGAYWTCNIAYRRDVFLALGGFRAEVFVNAHAEDRDLALRAMASGEVGFDVDMEVSHTPRQVAVRDIARQARWARDDLILYALHPDLTTGFALPARLALVVGAGKTWLRYGLSPKAGPSWARLVRAVGVAAVASTATAWAVLRTPSTRTLRLLYAERSVESR